ncbi:MAG TPA: 50S ribosomal protein L11 methyltransferase [Blastocatellia bacterium]|nr:50S ribosomal protein L11 methyltransferase [Blastocatellia bacterium]
MTDKATDKDWQLVTLTVARETEETASALLFDAGTTGIITLEESEDTVKLGAYFDAAADAEQIARDIEAAFARAGIRSALAGISLTTVADQDWMQKWKEGFAPLAIGERLMIAPSWKLPDATARIVIEIDPGMAFGTGTHETTRMCLELLEAHWRGGRLLDVGTGTGILAIAASKLAPGSVVVAIDIDPLAVEVARENIEINQAADAITIREGQPASYTGGAFDVVVANLTAEVNIALMSDLVGCLATPGTMILSGILTTLAADVERALEEAGLRPVERRAAGEWTAMVATRENA